MSHSAVSRELSELPVDQRGHRHTRRTSLDGVQFGGRVNGKMTWFSPDLVTVFSCALCDEYPQFTVVEDGDGKPVSLHATSECSLPDGLKTIVDLAVPSGILVVSDDLRPVYGRDSTPRGEHPGYNSVAGQAHAIRDMAAQGCAYGPAFFGPSLVRTGKDRYVIASIDTESQPGEEEYLAGVVVAKVSTNLWAYSIADFQDWRTKLSARLRETPRQSSTRPEAMGSRPGYAGADPTTLPYGITAVDVTPGVYRFTYHGGEAQFDYDVRPAIYADVERVRDD